MFQRSGTVSKFMIDVGYRSPSETGRWSLNKALACNVPYEIWLAYFFPSEKGDFDKSEKPEAKTRNEHLASLQFDVGFYENGLVLRYLRDAFLRVATLDEWSERNPLPPIPETDQHAALVAIYGKPFLTLGSYSGALANGLAVFELGLHRYWPLRYNVTHTIKEPAGKLEKHGEYCDAYFREVREKVYEFSREICGVGSPPIDGAPANRWGQSRMILCRLSSGQGDRKYL